MTTNVTSKNEAAAKGASAPKGAAAPLKSEITVKNEPAPKSAGPKDTPPKAATSKGTPPKGGKADGGQSVSVFGSLTGLRTEANHLFDGMVTRVGKAPALFRGYETAWRLGRRRGTVSPAVDIVEDDTALTLTAELPGLGAENIELVLGNNRLTLKGEKKGGRDEKKDNYFLSERHYGAFERSFRMPDDANTDKITAVFEQGVLTVAVPKKKPEAKAPDEEKKIRIEAK